ncbi:helix-turn-helix domain-containing protein [Streptomyces lavendulae]
MHLVAARTRMLELLGPATAPERSPRALGVDEFAFRKGRTYGTLLVKADRAVDVLPDRTSETFAACLRERADEETAGISEAPTLMQLPLHQLPRTQILERTCQRHADVHKLVAAGWTISAIARRLNLDRKTVRRFRDTDLDQLLASAHERRPAGVLEPFKPYLNT